LITLLINRDYCAEITRRPESTKMEDLKNDVLDFLLLSYSHQDPHVKPIKLQEIYLNLTRQIKLHQISKEELLTVLNTDPLLRFQILYDGVEYLISIKGSLNMDNERIVYSLEKWRQNLSDFLMGQNHNIQVNLLGSKVPRPNDLVGVKLKNVFLYDPLSRFRTENEGPNLSVKVNLNTDEIDEIVAAWLNRISEFLVAAYPLSVSINEISKVNPRPFRIPNSIKITETIRNDPLRRFHVIGDRDNVRVKSLVELNPLVRERYAESWRTNIAAFLFKKDRLVSSSDIGANVPRPGQLSITYKLQDVVKSDPRKRFIFKGNFNQVSVKLTTAHMNELRDLDCSDGFSEAADDSNSEEGSTGGGSEWINVIRKSTKYPLKEKVTNENPRKIDSNRPPGIMKQSEETFSHFGYGFPSLSIEPSHLGDGSNIGDSQKYENSNTDYLNSLLELTNSEKDHFSQSSLNEHNFESPSLASLGNVPNGLWANSSSFDQALIPTPVFSPFGGSTSSQILEDNLRGEGVVNPIVAVSGNTNWLELKVWLPTVLSGFDSVLVGSIVIKMRDDFGFLSTEDLSNAKAEGQLTFEVLKDIDGFKIGHYNRLVKGLTALGH
jgi:hypothetical protein